MGAATLAVYLLHDPATDTHKIGLSTDPVRRVRQLSTAHSAPLRLVTTFLSAHAAKIENSLHHYYARGRKLGEWFDLTAPELADFEHRCQEFHNWHERRSGGWLLEELL